MIIEKNGYVLRHEGDKAYFVSVDDGLEMAREIQYAQIFDTMENVNNTLTEIGDCGFSDEFKVIPIEATYWLEDDNEDEEDDIYELVVPKIKFAKMREDAIIPSKTIGNVGYDIYACFPDNQIKIEPHETKLIPTGIASIIPDGYAMILKDRGSTGSKGLSTACGVIDANFRGEWFVAIHNENDFPVYIIKDNVEAPEGKCICYPYKKAITQAILIEDINAIVEEIDKSVLEANVTDRGAGALGSSGK